ncbi:hypothetical protein ScPMuIL_000768 [Solemya velum]
MSKLLGILQENMWELVIVVSILLVCGVTEGCPGPCTCSTDGWNKKAVCNSGNVADIVSGLTSDITYLSITSATNAVYLTENDFSNGPSAVQISKLVLTNSFVQQIADNTFTKLGNLKELDLSHNNIESIKNNAFNGLQSLQVLDLSNNRLSGITDIFTGLNNIQTLDLSYNQIANLPDGCFHSQTRLRSLTLDGNRLNSLRGYAFQGLSNLQILSLKKCGMRTIANDLFSIIRNIKKMDISENSLTDIPNNQEFRNLHSLKELYLQKNQISNLISQQFSGMSLEILDLSGNQIRQLLSDTFQYFNARSLDLSTNQLQRIETNAFRPMAPQLETLNLAQNGLGNIPAGVFEGLYQLSSLNLSTCRLQSLESDPFRSLPVLRELDISNNYLTSLTEHVVLIFSHLRLLRLHNNPWNCNCHIKPLKQWLDLPGAQNIIQCDPTIGFTTNCREQKCASPPEFAQYPIARVPQQNIAECSKESQSESLPVGMIIGTVIACVVLISVPIVVICICRRHYPDKQFKFQLCNQSDNSSHNMEEKKTQPLQDFDIGSLNETDRGFVVRNYFNSMAPDPGAVSRGLPSLTQTCASTCSDPSICTSTFSYPVGRESAV